jgi:23S rRNA (cytosine1962-C5)-methyltransferase
MLPAAPFEARFAARSALFDEGHLSAFRLFNGHLEGDPRYVVDVYSSTAVIFRQTSGADDDNDTDALITQLRRQLPWLHAILVKERDGNTEEARRGRIVHLEAGAVGPAVEVREHGVRYVVDLLMNQDASFYLDTRHLRRWLLERSDGRRVLNTFAYTGSLGVAARAGGAHQVVQTDLNQRFLNIAKASTRLNGFAVDRRDFQARDFFSFVQGAKLRGERFDTLILDPPYFSSTQRGTVDLGRNASQLINKVRPLVRSGGTLIVVNNALFLSGEDFIRELEGLCVGGWITIDELISVPEDITGYPATRRSAPPVDPAPFNHTTKMAVLRVRHK